ncbi:MAG TPA: DUF72 domain-containing protein [Methylophilaceae bacterium]|nr:DUF72 domain-containing protein [Methylophilaceae bacterium]
MSRKNDSGRIYIGISGWRYPPWRKVFYPEDLTQAKELYFASRALPSIEINGSFYGLQRPSSYLRWYDSTPPGFVFSVKAHRYITHIRKLREVEMPIANFLSNGLFHLKEKLGPILWQFPPSFRFDPALFENFLRLLPHDMKSALALAERREPKMREKEYLVIDTNRPMRHAVEIRNKSFIDLAFIDLLRKYDVALVVADTAGKWPYYEDVTSDFMYLRLHGEEELYASGYTDEALDRWAARISAWNTGSQPADAVLISGQPPASLSARNVYCYFDNDIKVKAPFDARKLLRRLGLEDGLQELDGSRS